MRHTPLDPADWPALARVLSGCFALPAPRWELFRERIGDPNLRTVHVDGRVAGGLGIYRMGQWFGGRSVPLGGFAGVGVAPEHRGRGVAAAMMTSALRALREDGVPLAGLYASTQRLYRSVGFEQAGNRLEHTLPVGAIGLADRGLPVDRVDPEEVRPLHRPVHGNLDRNEAMWSRLLRPPDLDVSAFRVGGEGYLVLSADPGKLRYGLTVRDWQAHTPAAARRLWTLLADHSSLADSVRWFGAATDAMSAHLPEHRVTTGELQRWMIRVLDVRAALEARGWPMGEGELGIEVVDPILPENAGRWRLVVGDGRAEVRPGGHPSLRLGVGGLAPLYTGLFDPFALRRLGWVEGDDRALATAARLFAAPEPWMADMY